MTFSPSSGSPRARSITISRAKRELGFAVLDDCFGAKATAALDEALDRDDPIRGIADLFSAMAHKLEGQRLTCGCPINNLAQEMSPLDEGFRERLQQIYKSWHRRIANALAGAQQRGVIRDEVDPGEVAYCVIATMQGAIGLAKNAQDATIFRASIKGLLSHLESIRKARGLAGAENRAPRRLAIETGSSRMPSRTA